MIVTPEVINPLLETVVADEPKQPLPYLIPDKFDKSLPKGAEVTVKK